MTSLAIIGAASSYTPTIVEAVVACRSGLHIQDIRLMDKPEPSLSAPGFRLTTIARFVQRQLAKNKRTTRITLHTDLPSALQNVDMVLTLFRAGGLHGRHHDEAMAIQQGILGQETQGWGGFASALRNIPVVLDICSELAKSAPNAWVINITNPVGILTQTFYRAGHERTVGICEIPTRMLAAIECVAPGRDWDYSYVGLNHLSWINEVIDHDRPVLARLSAEPGWREIIARTITDGPTPETFFQEAISLRSIPSPYLRYYYCTAAMMRSIASRSKTRAQICMEIDAELLRLYAEHDQERWVTVSRRRGGYLLGTAVANLLDSFHGHDAGPCIVCVPNRGVLPFISSEAVVETPVKIDPRQRRISSLAPCEDLPVAVRELISTVAAYETATVEAGIGGDYQSALHAISSHPLIGPRVAPFLLDETLKKHRDYLPQFK